MAKTMNPNETTTTTTNGDNGNEMGNILGNIEGQEIVVDLGCLYLTSAVNRWREQEPLRRNGIGTALSRHEAGQWGEVDEEDRETNDQALRDGERLLSAWNIDDRRVWIITEADRSVTTVLFPEDY